jgi:microcystin-dependent protein
MHWGQGPGLTGRAVGETGGVANVTLLSLEMGPHSHTPYAATGAGTAVAPTSAYWSASSSRDKQFATTTSDATMLPNLLGPAGGGQPHNNQPPFLVVSYIIALAGIYPSRS